MKPYTKARWLFACLIIGALVFWASGAWELIGHDHDPGKVCRVCSSFSSADAPVIADRVEAPRLESSPAPAFAESHHGTGDLLSASPLRGPPSASSV